jgi:hypothetical protein
VAFLDSFGVSAVDVVEDVAHATALLPPPSTPLTDRR